MIKTPYTEIRSKLRNLNSSQLAELAAKLGLAAEVHDVPDLVIDLAAEYIGDVPELARFIPA